MVGGGGQVAVGLGDHHQVGQLHDPALDALEVVAAGRARRAARTGRRGRPPPARDWPTPTVSTSTTSKPAASHSSRASRVRRATPPSSPPAGEGRMNASGSRARRSIRVLSPRIEPPAASCSTGRRPARRRRWPAPVRWRPKASMKVRLADAGRTADAHAAPRRPCGGAAVDQGGGLLARWSGRVDSTRVMARARARRSPPAPRRPGRSGRWWAVAPDHGRRPARRLRATGSGPGPGRGTRPRRRGRRRGRGRRWS